MTRRETVPLRGVDVRVDVHGHEGVPVVLLPGGAVGARSSFPGLIDALTPTTVVVHDRLGCGSSRAGGREISLRTWSDDLESLLDQLGMARVVLIGHSLGAAQAAFFVRRSPDRVAAALLLDATPITDPGRCATIRRLAAALAAVTRVPVLGPGLERLLVRASRARNLSDAAAESYAAMLHGDWLQDTAAAVRHLADDARAFAALPAPIGPPPVLVVSAERKPDRVRRADAALVELLGAERETWPGTTHSLHLERPDLVIERARSVLELAGS